MRECKRHPSESQPGGGICASCLQERLTWLWRGESHCLDNSDKVVGPGELSSSSKPHELDANPLASQVAIGSIASVKKQLQVNGVVKPGDISTKVGSLRQVSTDILDGEQTNGGDLSPGKVRSLGYAVDGGKSSGSKDFVNAKVPRLYSHDTKDVIVEWTEFHARRRRNNVEQEFGGELDFPHFKGKIPDLRLTKPSSDFLMDTEGKSRMSVEPNPRLSIVMSAQRMRSRAMPLDNRSAEETALRVISEQADDLYFEEFQVCDPVESVRDDDGDTLHDNMKEQSCFSPVWQARMSPKWVKVLVSPMTSRNRVFPSRSKEEVRKGRGSRKRSLRLSSSDWNHKEINGRWPGRYKGSRSDMSTSKVVTERMSEQISRDDMGQPRITLRSSVFWWLQDASDSDFPQKNGQVEQLTSSSSSSVSNSGMDSWLKDLTTVGHLHEIAEEVEIFEESSEEDEESRSTDLMGEVSSFGKFLIIAAQRQPKAGLTRVISASAE